MLADRAPFDLLPKSESVGFQALKMDSAYHAASSLTAPNGRALVKSMADGASWSDDQGEMVLARSDFEIRLANGAGGVRSHVGMLVQRLYAWKGLSISPAVESTTRPNEITLAAYRNSVLFGTLTLGLDSPTGLFVDDLYRDYIDDHRALGARIFEITRLAIDPCFNSKEVLATIFNLAYIYARLIHGMTDAFVEVNPRHVGFYRRMMGFSEVGEERFCERVSAPARLLHLPMTLMDELVGKFGGRPESGDRSLYSYFFSQEEQVGIVNRLRRGSLLAQA